jgi:hypothetical protein
MRGLGAACWNCIALLTAEPFKLNEYAKFPENGVCGKFDLSLSTGSGQDQSQS